MAVAADTGARGRRALLGVPLLFAAYPPLSFYQHNIDQVTVAEVAAALGLALAASVLLTAIAYALFRRSEAAALGAAGVLAAFFSYGHLFNLLSDRGLLVKTRVLGLLITTNRLLTVVFVLALAALAVALLLRRLPEREAAKLAAVLGATLLVVSATMTGLSFVSAARAETGEETVRRVTDRGKAAPDDPDIYYIVLDRYMGKEALKELSGYDNEPFLGALRSKGFFVADEAYANYAVTYLSLGATLNMRYLSDATDLPAYREKSKLTATNRQVFYERVRDNEVARHLQRRGYEYVAVASGWGATNVSPIADRLVDTTVESEFASEFLKTTWARPLVNERTTAGKRERVLRSFSALDGFRDESKPVFVFAHLMVPHPPYVFAEDGSRTEYDADAIKRDQALENGAYVDQLKYTNELVLREVEKLTRERGRPVVVIVQGDHGANYRRPGVATEQGEVQRRRLSIINALYFSNGAPEELYPAISPVNTFRLVFSHYFGEETPMLPDRALYSSTEKWPYWPKDVTARIRSRGKP